MHRIARRETCRQIKKTDFRPPELPPVPNPVNPPADAENWLWRHHDVNDGVNNHENKPDEFDPVPAPLTADVTSANPLEVDVFNSIRSPYSYLVINRLAYLQSNLENSVFFFFSAPLPVGLASAGLRRTMPPRRCAMSGLYPREAFT